MLAILAGASWYAGALLICISLMAKAVEHLIYKCYGYNLICSHVPDILKHYY